MTLTPDTPSPTETITGGIRAYGPNCNGCLRYHRQVMLTYFDDRFPAGDPGHIRDVFLTNEQAVLLHKELSQAIGQNNA